jgi:hypothetical protein
MRAQALHHTIEVCRGIVQRGVEVEVVVLRLGRDVARSKRVARGDRFHALELVRRLLVAITRNAMTWRATPAPCS